MRKLIFIGSLVLLPFVDAVLAVGQHYEISNTDSTVRFEITKWLVFREEGRFRNLKGDLYWDPADPGRSRIEVDIDTSSLDTGNKTRDKVVRSDDFLWVKRYPQMIFRSTRIEMVSDRRLMVTGHLTIRGKSKEMTVPARFLGSTEVDDFGKLIAFQAEFQVKRSEFGVLGSRWSGGRTILGDAVDIFLTIGAVAR